nr:hypothetical protein [uncultured Rhodopila sp.]
MTPTAKLKRRAISAKLDYRPAHLDPQAVLDLIEENERLAVRVAALEHACTVAHRFVQDERKPSKIELDAMWIMARAAIPVFGGVGIEICDPAEGSLDDRERELWCGLLRAMAASLDALRAAGFEIVPQEATMRQLGAGQMAWLNDPQRRSSTLYRAMVKAVRQESETPTATEQKDASHDH